MCVLNAYAHIFFIKSYYYNTTAQTCHQSVLSSFHFDFIFSSSMLYAYKPTSSFAICNHHEPFQTRPNQSQVISFSCRSESLYLISSFLFFHVAYFDISLTTLVHSSLEQIQIVPSCEKALFSSVQLSLKLKRDEEKVASK